MIIWKGVRSINVDALMIFFDWLRYFYNFTSIFLMAWRQYFFLVFKKFNLNLAIIRTIKDLLKEVNRFKDGAFNQLHYFKILWIKEHDKYILLRINNFCLNKLLNININNSISFKILGLNVFYIFPKINKTNTQ